MNRRAFLAAIAAGAVDPERLLWRPGARLISIARPSLHGWEVVYDEPEFYESPRVAIAGDLRALVDLKSRYPFLAQAMAGANELLRRMSDPAISGPIEEQYRRGRL